MHTNKGLADLDQVAINPNFGVRIDGADCLGLLHHESTGVHRVLVRPHLQGSGRRVFSDLLLSMARQMCSRSAGTSELLQND